jgi:hypothetical protein
MNLVNLTPHVVNLGDQAIAPEENPARCKEEIKDMGTVDGIPFIRKELGELYNLPEAKPNTVYIVSLACALKAWDMGRYDVVAIGETVRDENGRICGCKSLAVGPKGLIFEILNQGRRCPF